MRLWSIHAMYLDSIGLTACWREGLLARKVLLNQTKGYKNHPQLIRFKKTKNPVEAIDAYLSTIFKEASCRQYKYSSNKIQLMEVHEMLTVTNGQLLYEFEHLKQKLAIRNPLKYNELLTIKSILPNPLFKTIEGGIENWEVIE